MAIIYWGRPLRARISAKSFCGLELMKTRFVLTLVGTGNLQGKRQNKYF